MLNDAGLAAVAFPGRELILHEYVASHDTERERLFGLQSLLSRKADVVVATPAAAGGYTIPRAKLAAASLSLSVGDICEMDEVRGKLVEMGYAACELVEGAGQFACRGGILDLYPSASEMPYRIEFFGDEIDRICHFDPLTQRNTESCERITLLPAHEVLID
jgi:transcription-repair coupling factor (superfamily II helicase)